jgi:WD40 repeat protein
LGLSFWQTSTGKFAYRLPRAHLASAPDGKTIVLSDKEGFHTFDAETGRELGRQACDEGEVKEMAISPDSKLLATTHVVHGTGASQWEYFCCLRDARTGQIGRRFLVPNNSVPGRAFGISETLAFSANGRFLAQAYSRDLNLWVVATGEHRSFPGEPTEVNSDRKERHDKTGQVVAATGKKTEVSSDRKERQDKTRQVVAMTGGPIVVNSDRKERHDKTRQVHISSVIFSPDSKTLATVEGNTVVLHEVATGCVRRRLKGHQDLVYDVAFDPGGRELVSVSFDNTALVWDLANYGLRPIPLSRAQLECLWVDLAGTDAKKAYEAIWALALAPSQTVPFLQNRLLPVPARDSQRIKQLIADLNSQQFQTRSRAAQELESLGELAEPTLREALTTSPSLEARRQLERLLEIRAKAILPPDRLRDLRAIEVLEHIGSPAARQQLEALAGGAPEAWLTQEARESLQRLDKHSGAGRTR